MYTKCTCDNPTLSRDNVITRCNNSRKKTCDNLYMRKYSVSWCNESINIPGVNPGNYETETALQVYCAHWLRKQYQLTHNPRFHHWHHSANERSNAREGMTAKLSGQSKGFPDLVNMGLKIAIELKLPKGRPSIEQLEWIAYLQSIGWTAEIARSFEEFKSLVMGVRTSGPPIPPFL